MRSGAIAAAENVPEVRFRHNARGVVLGEAAQLPGEPLAGADDGGDEILESLSLDRQGILVALKGVIARDSALTDAIVGSPFVPGDPSGMTSWQVRIELEHDSTYYWGVAAHDGSFSGPLSASRVFIADSTKKIPVAVELSQLAATGQVGSIVVRWGGADPEDCFRVLRSDAERGPYLPVGRGLLTGEES